MFSMIKKTFKLVMPGTKDVVNIVSTPKEFIAEVGDDAKLALREARDSWHVIKHDVQAAKQNTDPTKGDRFVVKTGVEGTDNYSEIELSSDPSIRYQQILEIREPDPNARTELQNAMLKQSRRLANFYLATFCVSLLVGLYYMTWISAANSFAAMLISGALWFKWSHFLWQTRNKRFGSAFEFVKTPNWWAESLN